MLAGITIIYADAASPPSPAPAGPPPASVLALPLSAVMEGPFVLSAGAPAAAGFQAPPYLQAFRFSELPAYSLLPTASSLPLPDATNAWLSNAMHHTIPHTVS
jgi:hypothetical protein